MSEPTIAFCCSRSAWLAAQELGQAPGGVGLVEVPCSGRVDVVHILRAVEEGARRILVIGCHLDNCKSIRGNVFATARVERANALLAETGSSARAEMHHVAANDPVRLKAILVGELVESKEE